MSENKNISTPSREHLWEYLNYQYPATCGDLELKKFCTSIARPLREYYIAHAPATPWSWFRPVMTDKPVEPKYSDEKYNFDNLEKFRLDNWLSGGPRPTAPDCENSMLQFIDDTIAYRSKIAEWRLTEECERDLQWPAFWADQMIKQGEHD